MSITEVWCRAYTSLVPEDEADRRRAEISSYLHDARSGGVSGLRLAVETGLGLPVDLAWSDSVRRRHGAVSLALLPLMNAAVGACLAGVLIVLSLAWSIITPVGSDGGPVAHGLDGTALVLVLSGHVVTVFRRRRP